MVMQTIQIRLPKGIITEIDKKVKTGFYANRSDFIRDHLRRKIEIKDLIGIVPNTGDSVEEVREIRKKLSSEIKSYEDLKRMEDKVMKGMKNMQRLK